MSDFPSYRDLFRIARDEVLSRNSLLTQEIVEREGSDANALTASGVAVGDSVVGQLIRVYGSMFMSSAKKTDLDRVIFDRYQLPRKGASPARDTAVFSTTAPNPGSFSIPSGTQLKTTDGKTFVTTAAATFPAGFTSIAPVPVQSVLSGADQQIRIGTLTNIASVISGAPADLAVTNPTASTGADDEEEDEDYQNRGQRFYSTSKRGTISAIETGALAVPGVRAATAFEAIDSDGFPARFGELVIADAFTEQLVDTSTVPPSYQTQAQTLATAVLAGLSDVRAMGIHVNVRVAIVKLLGVSLALRFRVGADMDAAEIAARGAIVNYVNSLQPGQSFIYADAINALKAVPGLVVLGGEIVSPPGDVEPETLEVLRTYIGYVTIGICTQVVT